MGDGATKVVIDDETVNSGGGTQTSDTYDVYDRRTVTAYVEGDGNTSDIDLVLEGRVRQDSTDSWAEVDASITGEDITATSNNAKGFSYEVEDYYEVRWVVTNGAGSNTDITLIASSQEFLK